MKVVVALDSFKGSIGSREAGHAVRDGIVDVFPHATVHVLAIADGGDGTLEAVVAGRSHTLVETNSVDALGRPVRSSYAVCDSGALAVVEAARTIGLALVAPVDERLPPNASSYGLGRQLRDALESGAPRLVVALGGTATTDGGIGMLAALGARITDDSGKPGNKDANPLWSFGALESPGLPDLSRVEVLVDVLSPLLGPSGAAHVFGPQKGATPGQVAHLEQRMTAWAKSLTHATGQTVADEPGAGAAGGLGAAFLAAGAQIRPGFDVVARETGLDELIRTADLVFTGEGSLDAQTDLGKAPAGVARRAREAGALVVALGGRVQTLGAGEHLFDATFPIHREPVSDHEAMDSTRTATGLRATAGEVVRLVEAARLSRRRHQA